MALARNALSSGTDVHTRIRFEVGDPSTDPAGNTKAAGELRFSTTEIDEALEDQLVDMSSTLDAFSPARSLLSVDVVLSEGAGTFTSGVGLSASAIYRVDVLDANGVVEESLHYVPLTQMNDYPTAPTYTLVGGTDLTTSDIRILTRPKSDDTIRIWYVAPPIVTGSTSDNVPMSDRWREYLVLGAAMKLLRVTGDATDDQRIRFDKLEGRFAEFCDRVRGPRRATMRRW
jgi:hypothetical protein